MPTLYGNTRGDEQERKREKEQNMDRGNKNKRPLTSIKCTSLLEWKSKSGGKR